MPRWICPIVRANVNAWLLPPPPEREERTKEVLDDLKFIDRFSNLLAQANSASDLCRKLVHSELTSSGTIGASLFNIDQQAHFNLVGSYGKGLPSSGVTVWDEHPFGFAARERKLFIGSHQAIDGSQVEAYCLPLLKGAEPIGLMCLTLASATQMHSIRPEGLSALSRVAGIWLESLNLGISLVGGDTRTAKSPSPESLTDRQLMVLRLMAEGKTNAQIAQELILSESTIRQETVKIYRSLGVSARSEASKRAKHLGLIDRVAI